MEVKDRALFLVFFFLKDIFLRGGSLIGLIGLSVALLFYLLTFSL